ncbi:hypothetical protein C7212DRAFT_365796 [Tuber magnatum]|uniref:Uncharacterized protein n=1 Tax=Tuber magnatum TaxID=42249 RepID=A0A317SID5_9PEZI|nr:hypothetical protein C7212DRAFT_365796 [Tuber magnatum]
MATEVARHLQSSSARQLVHAGALSPFSSLAMMQPQTNRLAAWMLDPDAPFCEQPPAKRIHGVLHSVHEVEVRFAKQTKPVDDIVAVIARFVLRNGYAAISQITNASNGQSRGDRGSQSSQRNSGGTGQNAPGSTVPLGAGNGGGDPSKRPIKRGGSGDGEGNPNKKKKVSNEPHSPEQRRCIVYRLSAERGENHPCKDKWFETLGSAIEHYLRMHVAHIQCQTCLIRKGTTTDMGKHKQARGCTPPTKIRDEISVHGENIRKVKSWDDLERQVAPNGKIQYDIASGIDINPRDLQILRTDSGYCDLGGPSSQQEIKVYHHQHSEMLNQTNTGEGVTSENEVPEQESNAGLLKPVNQIIEAFQEYDKDPTKYTMAQEWAQNIASALPESILKVFAEKYQNRVCLEREAQALGGAKGKEQEQYRVTVDGG